MQLKDDRQRDYACFFGTFFLAAFFCWLLSLAYPEGLINEETLTYWLLQKDFHWFSANQLDWYRTIPFGALLGFCSRFENPTSLVYWLYSLVFSLDIAITYVLGRILFSSQRLGLALSMSALLFEVFAMRTLYNNLGMSTDAIFGELVTLGALLALIAWLTKKPSLLLSSFAIFGLTAFIKPSGLALWPVWLPFAFCFVRRQTKDLKRQLAWLAASLILLTGPIAFWSLRNYCIFGYAKSSGLGGCLFLQGVLPLLDGREVLFADRRVNADFHIAVQECERDNIKRYRPTEGPAFRRFLRYERSFFYGPSKLTAFHVLARVTDPTWNKIGYQLLTAQNPWHMFRMDAEAGRVAMLIVLNHPLPYLCRVASEYVDMFSPLSVWTSPLYVYQANPNVAYTFWDRPNQGPRYPYPELYGGKPGASGRNSNLDVAKLLGFLHDNILITPLLTCYYACQFLLSHLLFFSAVFLFFLLRKNTWKFPRPESTRLVALSMIMMFLTAAANYLIFASCHVSKLRYQLAGDMLLHLLLLLGCFEAVRSAAPSWRQYCLERGWTSLRSIIANQPPDRKIAASTAAGIFFLSAFFCWLLSLAYPEGLINEETLTYWMLQKDFRWFEPNQLDWYRTVPYGLLLGLFAKFSNPTNALYWLNSLIFSLNYALVFVLGLFLFASRRAALLLAGSSLIFEIVSMRTFYNNLDLSPDALMANSIYSGVLLALIGWMHRSSIIFLSGYALMGLNAFMKPLGIGLWPLWLPFGLLFALRQSKKISERCFLTGTMALLLTGPLLFWCIRNYLVYGYAASSAMGGCSYLQAALPTYRDDDRLFDDEKTNTDFRKALRSCVDDSLKRIAQPDERFNANVARQFAYERYFITGPAVDNPFQVLASIADPRWHGRGYHWLTEFTQEHMFKMNAEAGRAAWRLIWMHPIGYLQLVMQEYVSLFSPLQIYTNPLYSYQSDPAIALNYWDYEREGPRQKYPELYRGRDFSSSTDSNIFIGNVLGAISNNRLTRLVLRVCYALNFWFSHISFVVACAALLLTYRLPGIFRNLVLARRTSIALIMLFLTAAFSYLLIASCQIARLRYQLIGDMELHLVAFVVLVTAITACSRPIREKASQLFQISNKASCKTT